MFLHVPRFAPKVTSRMSPVTLHRVVNLAHVRLAEYNRTNQTLVVEFSNGEARTFMNVDSSVLSVFTCIGMADQPPPPPQQGP